MFEFKEKIFIPYKKYNTTIVLKRFEYDSVNESIVIEYEENKDLKNVKRAEIEKFITNTIIRYFDNIEEENNEKTIDRDPKPSFFRKKLIWFKEKFGSLFRRTDKMAE